MLGILALLVGTLSIGLTVLPSSIGDGGGSGPSEEPDRNLDDYTDERDLIVSDEHEDVLTSVLSEVEGPTPEPELIEGALRVDAGAGDDVVVGSSAADIIEAGDGDDVVAGGDGNDRVYLEEGDDVYGLSPYFEAYATEHLEALGVLEHGNDKIRGGAGDDMISDRFGSNRLIGNQGADLLVALDDESEEAPTPDIILGGFGNDQIHADEGDTIVGGRGQDTITLHLPTVTGEAAPQPIVIQDFFKNVDALELEGIGDGASVSIQDIEDGSGAQVLLDGVVVATVLGGAGLTLDDISGV